MNPLLLVKEIEDRYTRYLETTFYFRDPELRASFEMALRSGRLVQGPYLEAIPNFVRGSTPGDLVPRIFGFEPDESFLHALAGNRPLYRHQEQAIRAIASGRNVVVATGTGSGKTESFLYPILLHLYSQYREGTLDRGVRALILYPMNALAHDQRERLGDICRALRDSGSPFCFTFGQYVGETPEDENDHRRHAREQLAAREEAGFTVVENGEVVHGEVLLRSEMRRRPPHILLTNYSMLEYMLLRPDDSPLFDGMGATHWKFFVLDEAHQYRGARGTEMAVLLRRLQQRLREAGCKEEFRFIGTSATLASGTNRRDAVARFAAALFNSSENEWEVIEGERYAAQAPTGTRLDSPAYTRLCKIVTNELPVTSDTAAAIAKALGIAHADTATDPSQFAGQVLARDDRVRELRVLLESGPQLLDDLESRLFADIPDEERPSAFSDFLSVVLSARDPSSNAPLLSCRYHIFVRALEGAFISYFPERQVFLDRKSWDGQRTAFELALCRECGQHYFVGRRGITEGTLQEPVRDPTSEQFGAAFFRPLDRLSAESELQLDLQPGQDLRRLCTQCGALSRGAPDCGHAAVITVVVEPTADEEERADQLQRCGACQYTAAGRDPVRELVHGADGPSTVIATALAATLPPARRKVLAFADSRLDAAHFAWYLDDSYDKLLRRHLIFEAVRRRSEYGDDGLSLRELARSIQETVEEHGVLPPETGRLDLERDAWRRTYAEFLTDETRLSLEGVGLVRWYPKRPPYFSLPQELFEAPLRLTPDEGWQLVQMLLDVMRRRHAIELSTPDGVSLNWRDLGLHGSTTLFRLGAPGGNRNVTAWDGERGSVVNVIKRVLQKSGVATDSAAGSAIELARRLWQAFIESDRAAPANSRALLLRKTEGRVLNPDWWRVAPIGPNDTIYRCDTCSRVQFTNVRGVCMRYGCPGTVYRIAASELNGNHYRDLYQAALPTNLRVEEHTAQLNYDTAREYQRDFREGRIHVLSCSTTFELGVDLGTLDVVFLRNVPPESFNYAQRVGRAGRRPGFPGIAITFCRRNPHDLYHFANPGRMLRGEIRAPVIHLGNEKILIRHVAAVALSAFFRSHKERFYDVESLFVELSAPSAVNDFRDYLLAHRWALERTLTAVIPQPVHEAIGIRDGGWIDRVAGPESRFQQAEQELASDYRALIEIRERAFAAEDYRAAAWSKDRANTIKREDVLSFLSRKAVIPKYGFPVDVVELATQGFQPASADGGSVAFQRDLEIAISEFAPSSELIANKLVWRSYGLKKVAEREWERWWYAYCPIHHLFARERWTGHEQRPRFTRCCNRMSPSRLYISPRFGFVTSRTEGPAKPRGRPVRLFSTRPYFLGFADPSSASRLIQRKPFAITPVSPGHMVVLAEGRSKRGFYICPQCGFGTRGTDPRPRAHRTPFGFPCQGHLEIAALGHDFVTDVLRIMFHLEPPQGEDPEAVALSVAFALVEGAADVLDVPGSDISTAIAYRADAMGIQPIVLFDRVPGGAGLVSRLQDLDVFKEAVRAAVTRVGGACGCDPNTSCYGCLRNFRNQFAHDRLQRGLAHDYLSRVLGAWE